MTATMQATPPAARAPSAYLQRSAAAVVRGDRRPPTANAQGAFLSITSHLTAFLPWDVTSADLGASHVYQNQFRE
ncbi:hypothetical protein [Actinomadura sp. NPDC049753]|uniref:hypothetical protein n=1 Tax=Actinomadura sp. NPDC049753 TaxID=3154739 RepID=UPI0034356434